MRELNMISNRYMLFTEGTRATTIAVPGGRAPRLALLPSATPPKGGLVLSALAHTAAVFALLTWLPLIFPGRKVFVANADTMHEPDHEVIFLPILPKVERAGSPSEAESGSKKKTPRLEKPEAEASQLASGHSKPDFAGPQEIVSDLPDSTNSIQTIRRPDLIEPPKLSNPVRLQSLVMLPAHATQVPVTPQIAQPLHPALPNTVELAPLQVSEPRAPVLALSMSVPKQSSAVPLEAVTEAVMPKVAVPFDQALSSFAPTAPSAPKAAVVINAVSVPSDSAATIPDAELSGKFIVGPSTGPNTNGVNTKNAGPAVAGSDNVVGTGSSNEPGTSPHVSAGNVSGTGLGTTGSGTGTGAARTGSISIMGGRLGPGGGSGTAAGAGIGSMPGISISGGNPSRSSGAATTTPIPRGSYAITVISGGSSGGASRDLGVFSRSDTVYTVYIPMTDAGGGPDWSVEYALINSAPSGNGLLTPPMAVKKIRATGPKSDVTGNSGPVFVSGIIDEKGKAQALRAIRASDARTQCAVNALAQWEFLPAQLDGKPVASKVLIGVIIMPAEVVGKLN